MRGLVHLMRSSTRDVTHPPRPKATPAPSAPPTEVGTVRWGRRCDEALARSRASGVPVLILFQEVPGCVGCRQFGQDVLSHARIVDAIEHAFIPLLVRNNAPGEDAATLARFAEPAFNYQVVRFVDGEGADVIPRQDRVWQADALVVRMLAALRACHQPVPAQLELLASELSARVARAALCMPCFWEGEGCLGQIDGVVSTEAGFVSGREAVLVAFDPAVLPLAELIRTARARSCADICLLPAALLSTVEGETSGRVAELRGYRRAPEEDQKRQLRGTPAAALAQSRSGHLSAAQLTKLNAWLRTDPERALSFLTREQRVQLGSTTCGWRARSTRRADHESIQ